MADGITTVLIICNRYCKINTEFAALSRLQVRAFVKTSVCLCSLIYQYIFQLKVMGFFETNVSKGEFKERSKINVGIFLMNGVLCWVKVSDSDNDRAEKR